MCVHHVCSKSHRGHNPFSPKGKSSNNYIDIFTEELQTWIQIIYSFINWDVSSTPNNFMLEASLFVNESAM